MDHDKSLNILTSPASKYLFSLHLIRVLNGLWLNLVTSVKCKYQISQHHHFVQVSAVETCAYQMSEKC